MNQPNRLSREEYLNFPVSFQKDLFDKLLKIVSRSESVFLFGPPGMGKSMVLSLLLEKLNKQSIANVFINAESIVSGENPKIEPDPKHFVIILDNLDKLADPKYEPFLLCLKSLREKFRPGLSFIFAADSNITQDVRFSGLDPIKRLVVENIIFLNPLDKTDAKTFTEKCIKLYKANLNASKVKDIIFRSGGVPRLIKRLVRLSVDEIDPASDPQIKIDLEGIISFNRQNPSFQIKPPILSVTSKEKVDTVGPITFSQRLTSQEYDLIKILVENEGNLISREELIKAVWPKNQLETSDHALDQMLHRLRKKIESASPKCNLITYRGRGCRLETL